MIKMKDYILIAIVTLASTVCCSKIDVTDNTINLLDISVRNSVTTKSLIEGTTLPANSEIGVFVIDESGRTYDGNTITNVKYIASGEGESQKWDAGANVLLSASEATVFSYYPYDESIRDFTYIPIEVTSENQKDWMWGTPVSNIDNTNNSAVITMNHALAVIRLNIVKGNFAGTGNVNYVSIKSTGAGTSAIMNAATGALTNIKGTGYIFESTDEFTLSEGGNNVDFIVVPAGTETPYDICMLVNGTEMVATTAAMTLEAGKIYEYTVSVGVEELQLNKLNVTEWIEQNIQEEMFAPSFPVVNISGTFNDIIIEQTIKNKSVTIKAFAKTNFYKVKEVTVTGGTYNQSIDDNGVRTIEITDILSAATINFTGTEYNSWARIQHVDGTLYTAEEWLAAETAGTVTDADANGVAIKHSKVVACPHVIYPTYTSDKIVWTTKYPETVIPGVTVASNRESALLDVNGKANTEAILAAVAKGIIQDAPAAQLCVETVFANGQKGYLPAAGELQAWYDNQIELTNCINAIGGSLNIYADVLSSTQEQYWSVWILTSEYQKILETYNKSQATCCHPVTSFSY